MTSSSSCSSARFRSTAASNSLGLRRRFFGRSDGLIASSDRWNRVRTSRYKASQASLSPRSGGSSSPSTARIAGLIRHHRVSTTCSKVSGRSARAARTSATQMHSAVNRSGAPPAWRPSRERSESRQTPSCATKPVDCRSAIASSTASSPKVQAARPRADVLRRPARRAPHSSSGSPEKLFGRFERHGRHVLHVASELFRSDSRSKRDDVDGDVGVQMVDDPRRASRWTLSFGAS